MIADVILSLGGWGILTPTRGRAKLRGQLVNSLDGSVLAMAGTLLATQPGPNNTDMA